MRLLFALAILAAGVAGCGPPRERSRTGPITEPGARRAADGEPPLTRPPRRIATH